MRYERNKSIADLRVKLKLGEISIGSWMQINSPDVAEIMGQGDFDWVAVDMEHGSISHADLPNLFRALELGCTLPLARIAEGTLSNCKQALDAGAGGVIIPMIMDAEQLKEIVSWCCWPPKGTRGVGYSRANLFGKHFNAYKQEAQLPFIVAQIEHIQAIENLRAILEVPGLDAIIIGPYDISASMGRTGELEHLDVVHACNTILDLSNMTDVASGIHVVDADETKLKIAIDSGYRFIAYSLDAVFFRTFATKP